MPKVWTRDVLLVKVIVTTVVKPTINPQYLGVCTFRGLPMSDLRNKVIRLAHLNPELRDQLLPLLQKTANNSIKLNMKGIAELSHFNCYGDTHPGLYKIRGVLKFRMLESTLKVMFHADYMTNSSGSGATRNPEIRGEEGMHLWGPFISTLLDQILNQNPDLILNSPYTLTSSATKITVPIVVELRQFTISPPLSDGGSDRRLVGTLKFRIGRSYLVIPFTSIFDADADIDVELRYSEMNFFSAMVVTCLKRIIKTREFFRIVVGIPDTNTMKLFIVTDFNTSRRYQVYAMSLDDAFQKSIDRLGDFPHIIDEMSNPEEVEITFGKPLSSFPSVIKA